MVSGRWMGRRHRGLVDTQAIDLRSRRYSSEPCCLLTARCQSCDDDNMNCLLIACDVAPVWTVTLGGTFKSNWME
jgi:hypothetical protein